MKNLGSITCIGKDQIIHEYLEVQFQIPDDYEVH